MTLVLAVKRVKEPKVINFVHVDVSLPLAMCEQNNSEWLQSGQKTPSSTLKVHGSNTFPFQLPTLPASQ